MLEISSLQKAKDDSESTHQSSNANASIIEPSSGSQTTALVSELKLEPLPSKQESGKKEDRPSEELVIGEMVDGYIELVNLTCAERSYTQQAVFALRQILKYVKSSIRLNPRSLLNADETLTELVLTPQGTVSLFNSDGSMSTRQMEHLSSDSILKVMVEALPTINALLVQRKIAMKQSISTLQAIAKEVREIPIRALETEAKHDYLARQQE